MTFEPFIVRALAAGIGIALIAGVMGCFVVWRRMAYFGDSLAHSALLGVALGLSVGITPYLGTLLTCACFACLLLWLQHSKILATDTLLGILAHSALSLGMVTLSLLDQRIDLHSYLFGDILSVDWNAILWIYLCGAFILTLLIYYWPQLILMTVHEDLAKAEQINSFFMQILLMFFMTLIVALSIRIVGILLITSMLIIPAAAARQLARSPEIMAVFASLFGSIAVILGVQNSLWFDIPTGPSIVAFCALLFVITMILARLIPHRLL